MKTDNIPVFAVMGHPNEGKSSVVATLAEDDTVPVSPTPGETRQCRQYPVTIDGREVICFVDTPGFQNPRAALNWITRAEAAETVWLSAFVNANRENPELADECELLAPLADGAGIIFVVDGSRPVRNIDRTEMEILRLTGLPRMAVINTKDRQHGEYIEEWKNAARTHFNTIRIFDAHRASFAERMALLESLKAIDPDWQEALQTVIEAFSEDWRHRINESAAIVTELLKSVLTHKAEKTVGKAADTEEAETALAAKYQKEIAELEKQAHARIKKRFKHNIFSYDLPARSMVNQDLFSRKTWKALGLTRNQMAWAGAGIGAGIGAKADLAAAGLSFGVFTALGGALGGGSGAWGTRKIARTRIKGQSLGGIRIRVGPIRNDQLLYVIIDRALIYFWHVINWAHSRRDQPEPGWPENPELQKSLTANWSDTQRTVSKRFFKAASKNNPNVIETAAADFKGFFGGIMNQISGI
ncbi:MAG: GTPase/DUF3482 domain-containing protein [Desulfobacterales bacterium]|nr:GTPase/DUF3482 domain-containing protein [Desulfobacterales bacterium]MBS3755617.1 GTPase/DUF3482 domain-containing protein [Desulfobacterales bacterium]